MWRSAQLTLRLTAPIRLSSARLLQQRGPDASTSIRTSIRFRSIRTKRLRRSSTSGDETRTHPAPLRARIVALFRRDVARAGVLVEGRRRPESLAPPM